MTPALLPALFFLSMHVAHMFIVQFINVDLLTSVFLVHVHNTEYSLNDKLRVDGM